MHLSASSSTSTSNSLKVKTPTVFSISSANLPGVPTTIECPPLEMRSKSFEISHPPIKSKADPNTGILAVNLQATSYICEASSLFQSDECAATF